MSAPDSRRPAIESNDSAIHFPALALLHRLGGEKLVGEIIHAFTSNAPRLIDAARAGAASGESGQVQRALHSLKSSAGQLGALRMQRLCSEGEMRAARGDRSVLASLVAELDAEFASARVQLETERANGLPHLVDRPSQHEAPS